MGLPDDPTAPDRSRAATLDETAGAQIATLAASSGVRPAEAPRDREAHAGAAGVKLRVEPGTVLKHYELIRKLGAGGMGMVFLARDTRLGRLVAIKFLLEHTGLSAERFLAEARTTAQCKHENIVVIPEVGNERLPMTTPVRAGSVRPNASRPVCNAHWNEGSSVRSASAGTRKPSGSNENLST